MSQPHKWLRVSPAVGVALTVAIVMAGTAMGALAFLQFTDWTIPFYLFAAIPLPVATLFLISRVLWPAINKSKKDDRDVSIVAFIIYYFTIALGWAMIWMIIFQVAPDSYEHISTLNPKDAYHVFGYILPGATFVSFRTAPSWVLPARLISNLVSLAQIWMAYLIEIIFLAFVMRIVFRHFSSKNAKEVTEISLSDSSDTSGSASSGPEDEEDEDDVRAQRKADKLVLTTGTFSDSSIYGSKGKRSSKRSQSKGQGLGSYFKFP